MDRSFSVLSCGLCVVLLIIVVIITYNSPKTKHIQDDLSIIADIINHHLLCILFKQSFRTQTGMRSPRVAVLRPAPLPLPVLPPGMVGTSGDPKSLGIQGGGDIGDAVMIKTLGC